MTCFHAGHCLGRVAALYTFLMALGGCGDGQPLNDSQRSSVPEVQVLKAEAADPSFNLRLPIRTEAGLLVRVHARATGLVAERRVDLGDVVAAGQVLAVIHAPEIDQAVRTTDAEHALAEANLKLARAHYERARQLIQSQVISRDVYDEREAAFEVAQASLAAAVSERSNLRERQRFQIVRAPIAGVITARHIEQGDRVIADQGAAATPLFELSTLDPLRVIVDVPQDTLGQVIEGQQVRLLFDKADASVIDAKVARLAQRVSPSTGAMRIELDLPNPDRNLWPGMAGQAEFILERSHPAVRVPVSALVQSEAQTQLIVVDGSNKLDFRPVKLGRNLGSQVEITEGVSAGDSIVVTPNARLMAAQTVRIR